MSEGLPADQGLPSDDARRRQFVRLLEWVVTELGYEYVISHGPLTQGTIDDYLDGKVPLKRQRGELRKFHFWVAKKLPDTYPPRGFPKRGFMDLAGSQQGRLDPSDIGSLPPDEADGAPSDYTSRGRAVENDQPGSRGNAVPAERAGNISPESGDKRPAQPPQRDGGRRRVVWAAAIGLVLVVLVIAFALRPKPNHSAAPDAILTFTDLGGGSSVIRVFSSPTDPKTEDGTFEKGQTAPVACRTTGRMVRSDPTAGERKRSSTDWVRLRVSQPMYATLTYGSLNRALSTIRHC